MCLCVNTAGALVLVGMQLSLFLPLCFSLSDGCSIREENGREKERNSSCLVYVTAEVSSGQVRNMYQETIYVQF